MNKVHKGCNGGNGSRDDEPASSQWAANYDLILQNLGGFTWTRCADLPDSIGYKGMYAGVSHGMLIAAGGSYFPISPSAGGIKVLSRKIFLRPHNAGESAPWIIANETLPAGVAEGAAVTTEHGIVGLAGQRDCGAANEVFLLRWDEKARTVRQTPLPPLPLPCISPAAVYWEGHIYTAGGQQDGYGRSDFWRIDLCAALAKRPNIVWQQLPSWPGPGRSGAVLSALETGGQEKLFLFGGRFKTIGPAVSSDYLADGYCYDARKEKWTVVRAMPYPAQLGSLLRIGSSQLAIVGGSDGHDLDKIAMLRERYRLADHIQVYNSQADRWDLVGTMPLGLAGAAPVDMGDSWMIFGGEYSPALRSPHVFRAVWASPDKVDRKSGR